MKELILLFFIIQQISPHELLQNIRKNLKFNSASFNAQLEIRKGKRILQKSFKGYSRGEDFYLEFTNPEDKGVRYLKLKSNLYIYLPDVDDVVRLSGDMLKQSFMGSDLSYEDLMQEDPLKYYAPILLKDTTENGGSLYFLELEDTTHIAPYFKICMLVDPEKNIWLREELYTKSGRKIKEVEVLETKMIKGRYYPISVIMRDLRLKDSYTKYTIKEMDLDIPVSDRFFKLSEISK